MAAHRTAPDPKVTGWPSGIPYIIGNEGCERFSYYGMRAILYVYVVGLLINHRSLSPDAANTGAKEVFHIFSAGVYSLPIIGAMIADRLLGKYLTIMVLSVVYCFGHLALALFESTALQERLLGYVFIDPVQGLYLGLVLIAIGSGGIKPCVSAHVGDQFGKGNWHLLQKVFNAFYFIVNFGSAFATLLIPMIRGTRVVAADGTVGYEGSVSWAFGVPGILMGLATIFFWMGRKKFVHVPPTHPGLIGLLDVLAGSALFMVLGFPIFHLKEVVSLQTMWIGMASSLGAFVAIFTIRQRIEADDGFVAVLFYGLTSKLGLAGEPKAAHEAGKYEGHWFFGSAARRFGEACVDGPVAVLRIISVFALICVFWALFDQHSSTWIEQAQSMDRRIDLSLFGWVMLCGPIGAIVAGAVAVTIARQGAESWMMLAIGLGIGGGIGAALWTSGFDELQPSQVPATNPFLVMILIPYTTFGLYPLMERIGFKPTPLRRMTIGMFIAGVSFVAVAIIQRVMDSGINVHVVWQIIPYVIITLAEVMVSITGLEFAYSQAPKRMKSVIMGFWSLNVALGNLLVVFVIAMFEDLTPQTSFWIFAGLMFAAAGVFGLRAAFYRYEDYTQ